MQPQSSRTQPAKVLVNRSPSEDKRERQVRALVVSSELEARKPLLRALEALRADVMICSSAAQAEEALSKQSLEIVFCDERLPDGSYTKLIHPNHWNRKIPCVVVTTRTRDWGLYFEAWKNMRSM